MTPNDLLMEHPAPAPPPPTPAPSPAAEPATTLPARRYSPGLAGFLSAFPGLGHLYLGLYQRGAAIFLCFAAAIWLGDHADVGILAAFVWFFAVFDAYRQAQNINSGCCPEPLVGVAQPRPGSRRSYLGFGVFLTVLGILILYNQFYPIDLSFLQTWWPLILVIAGVWLLVKHFIEQKRRENNVEQHLSE
ncbi:MAG: LiaI-LiaF-like domain-containing protein [Acidobacteriota bacterium]